MTVEVEPSLGLDTDGFTVVPADIGEVDRGEVDIEVLMRGAGEGVLIRGVELILILGLDDEILTPAASTLVIEPQKRAPATMTIGNNFFKRGPLFLKLGKK
ncbi:hypothetical protein [Aneurinibacillus tyrosinisolvens]|uniref:hypothetical protein n=1 Tax=Aneurinibacillus tyrosinisolvens TaxID=1443435 RepID=UPI00063F6559|nr:hypothetical protein [Aneurinibacillus tyrosinisolvens]